MSKKHCKWCGAELPDDANDPGFLWTDTEVRERERKAFVEGRSIWSCDKCGGPMGAQGYYKGNVVLFCAKCDRQKTIACEAWLNIPILEAEALRRYGGEA